MESHKIRNTKNELSKKITVGSTVFILFFAITYLNKQTKETKTTTFTQDTPVEQSSSPISSNESPKSNLQSTPSYKYNNGTYSAVGKYISPGGDEQVKLTISIKEDKIITSDFTATPSQPISDRFQDEFKNNYQPLVIGKNIDEISLNKVAGSSLTSKGFNDALSIIKKEAKS